MPLRFFTLIALIGLVAAPGPSAIAQKQGPANATLVVRFRTIESLIADGEYLLNLSGQEELAKQLKGAVGAMITEKGLQGIDTKKPLGMYGTVGPQGVDSTAVLLVPIADQKSFLDMLVQFGMKAKPGADGLYSVTLPSNDEAHFRFANSYVYITNGPKDTVAKDKLVSPTDVLPTSETAAVSAIVRIATVPKNLRDIFLTEFERRLAEAKTKKEADETPAQAKLKGAIIDNIFAQTKSLLTEGDEISVRLNVDRKAGELTAEATLSAQSSTKLSANIADLGKSKSLFPAMLGSDSAMNFLVNVSMADSLKKLLGPVIDEGIDQAIKQQKKPENKELAEKFLKVMTPTLKAGDVDFAITLRGPTQGDKYAALVGVKVKDGGDIDKVFREIVKQLKEEEQARIQLSAEKAGDIEIHKFDIKKDLDAKAKVIFGEEPLYLALRGDAALFAFGDGGLAVLKEALTAKPAVAPPLQFDVSMKRLAVALAAEEKAAGEAAKKIFGDGKGTDTVRITVDGGKVLKAKFVMKADVVKFFAEVNKAKMAAGN